MECRLFALFIQRYHDGELDAVARALYERHRAGCAACREIDRRYALVAGALDLMSVHEPSPEFNRRVLARVDVAAYRRGPIRRSLAAVERSWNFLPIPVRRASVIAAISALVIGVYKPLFDFFIRGVGLGAGGLWERALAAQELLERAVGVWKASGAVRNYEVVGEMLLRALDRPAAGLHPAGAIAIAAIVVAAAIAAVRMLGSARRKGESNVCLL